MSSEQQRFAQRVLQAFAAAGHHTDREVADASGPSSTTMTLLRKVAAGDETFTTLRSDTLRRIDAAANWQTGSAKAFWINGTEPTLDAMGYPISEGHGPPREAQFDPLDAYLKRLEARILETEERLDLVEAELERQGTGSWHDASSEDDELARRRGGALPDIPPTAPHEVNKIAARRGRPKSQDDPNRRHDIGEESQDPDDHPKS